LLDTATGNLPTDALQVHIGSVTMATSPQSYYDRILVRKIAANPATSKSWTQESSINTVYLQQAAYNVQENSGSITITVVRQPGAGTSTVD
jgi:hypothetical protein